MLQFPQAKYDAVLYCYQRLRLTPPRARPDAIATPAQPPAGRALAKPSLPVFPADQCQLRNWMKFFFTDRQGRALPSPLNCQLAALPFEAKGRARFSYEGLRLAQAFAMKSKPDHFLVSEQLAADLESLPMRELGQKALWRLKGAEHRFQFFAAE